MFSALIVIRFRMSIFTLEYHRLLVASNSMIKNKKSKVITLSDFNRSYTLNKNLHCNEARLFLSPCERFGQRNGENEKLWCQQVIWIGLKKEGICYYQFKFVIFQFVHSTLHATRRLIGSG